MRLHLLLIVALMFPIPAMANNAQPANIPENPATSQELNSLNAQRSELQTERDSLRGKQDFWHDWAVGLGLFAALVGLVAGSFAHMESKRAYAQRGVDDRLSGIDAKIASWTKTDSEWRIARLQKDTEDERTARVLLESKVAWRKLDAKTQCDMAFHLKRFSGESALVTYQPDDVEAASFAGDIAAMLNDAKWSTSEPLEVLSMREGPVPLGTTPRVSTGINIWSTDDEASRDAANSLIRQFIARGFDAKLNPAERSLLNIRPTPTRVVVSVAHKPEGAQGIYKLNMPSDTKH